MSHENQAFQPSGSVTLFPKTTDGEGPAIGPCNGDVLSSKASSNVIKIPDKRRGRRGQNMKTFNDPSAATGTLNLYSVSAKILAMLMLGTVVSRSDGSGTVTDKAISVPVDFWVPLGHPNVSSITVTSDPSGTTYVEDTDYEINPRLGLIRLIDGGALSATTDLLVSYTHSAVTANRIEVSTETTVRARILLEGINESDNSAFEWEAYSALLTPNGEFDLLSADPVQAQFALEFETPDGYDHPVRFDTDIVFATP